MKALSAVRAFLDDEGGATAIEYGLIAAVIGAALVTGMGTVNDGLKLAWDYIKAKMQTATST